ncbi:unnamed protein product [Cochlearia groenlandica]
MHRRTSKCRAIRNIYPIIANKEQRAPRKRAYAELSQKEERVPWRRAHAGPNRQTEIIAGHGIYIDSSGDIYGLNASDRSRRSHQRD